MPKIEKGRKLPKRYPWKEWFKLVKFTIYRGKDYTCQPHGMSAMIRNRAVQACMKAHIDVYDGGRIDVQLTKEH